MMMSASARPPPLERQGEQAVDDGALRLRGGCIPCPVSRSLSSFLFPPRHADSDADADANG